MKHETEVLLFISACSSFHPRRHCQTTRLRPGPEGGQRCQSQFLIIMQLAVTGEPRAQTIGTVKVGDSRVIQDVIQSVIHDPESPLNHS